MKNKSRTIEGALRLLRTEGDSSDALLIAEVKRSNVADLLPWLTAFVPRDIPLILTEDNCGPQLTARKAGYLVMMTFVDDSSSQSREVLYEWGYVTPQKAQEFCELCVQEALSVRQAKAEARPIRVQLPEQPTEH